MNLDTVTLVCQRSRALTPSDPSSIVQPFVISPNLVCEIVGLSLIVGITNRDGGLCPCLYKYEMTEYNDLWIAYQAEHESLCRLPSKYSNEMLVKSSAKIETNRFWVVFEECIAALTKDEEQCRAFLKLQIGMWPATA
jgi:hypothetical protein